MVTRSPYDQPIAWDDDGEPSLFDSDTREGQARIRQREAEVNAPPRIARNRGQSSEFSRKQLEELAESIAAQFVEERRKLRLDIREQLVEAREELAGLLASAVKIEREIEKLKKQAPRVVGGKDAA